MSVSQFSLLVRDEDGKPIPQCEVKLAYTEYLYEATTNTEGVATFTSVEFGTYTCYIDHLPCLLLAVLENSEGAEYIVNFPPLELDENESDAVEATDVIVVKGELVVANQPVQVTNQFGQPVTSGITNSQGIVTFELPMPGVYIVSSTYYDGYWWFDSETVYYAPDSIILELEPFHP